MCSSGPGVEIDEPGTNSPVRVAIANATYGLWFADTLNLTPALALTVSGRFNAAQIDLSDQNGGDLTGNHYYNHFNPAAGLTYTFAPWLTAYAGYAVATGLHAGRAFLRGTNNACSLANFFVGDPNLSQVVSHTIEAGLRGHDRHSMGPGDLQPRAVSQHARRRHRVHQQRHARTRLFRQYRPDATPGR